MDLVKKNSIWIGIGGCVLGIIGLFLSFCKVTVLGYTKTLAFIDGDGKIVLFCLIAAGILTYLKKGKFTLIPLAIALLITVYDGINVSRLAGNYSYAEIKLSIGFFTILIGTIVAGIMPFMTEDKPSNNSNVQTMNQFAPQMQQPNMMNQFTPQIQQPNTMNQVTPQMQQPDMMNQFAPQMQQPDMMNQVAPQMQQPDIMNQVASQMQQPNTMNQVTPQMQQPNMMNQVTPQMQQPDINNQSQNYNQF